MARRPPASARANLHRAGRAPHRARREAEAIGSGRRSDEGHDPRRIWDGEEIAAGTLDIRIAWPRNGRSAPIARIVVRRLARHLRRNRLPAREFADKEGRRAAVGPAGLMRRKSDSRRDLTAARRRQSRSRVRRSKGQGRGESNRRLDWPNPHVSRRPRERPRRMIQLAPGPALERPSRRAFGAPQDERIAAPDASHDVTHCLYRRSSAPRAAPPPQR
jgi:hypothetical protein